MAEGRWVKTIVGIRPMRLAMEAARSMPVAAMMLEEKKRVPSWPCGRKNLSVKK